jgi:hypothetical protein
VKFIAADPIAISPIVLVKEEAIPSLLMPELIGLPVKI